MKILITGAAGFVGGHLVKELLQNNHEVVAAVNNNEGQIEGVTTVLADLSNAAEVNERIDFTTVNAVIHLAGLAAVGPSFAEPLKYITVNAGIEISLYEACLKQNAKPKFLVISSGSLYDQTAPLPLTEQSPLLASSPYAVSKIAQEELARYYGRRGFEYVIARPFNHIGPGQNPGFIVPDITQQLVAVEKGEAAQIMVGNLDAKRDYTDVRDICRAYRLLVEKGINGQVYNICSGKSVSGNDILQKLLSISGVTAQVTPDPAKMRPADTPDIFGDISKITTDTGWQPSIALETTLSDVVADWRSR